MIKRKKKLMAAFLAVTSILLLAGLIFIKTPRFGSIPEGKRLERIKNSPNYKNGKFQNLSCTPQITGDKGTFRLFWDFLFKKSGRAKPKGEIPHIKTDLLNLSRDEDILVWLGHSSVFIQVGGKRFLTDPIFERAASPLPFFNLPFKGADSYTAKDIPDIDYLIITHDHWDHLDHKTALEMKPKLKKVICGLGVGAHFERWGYPEDMLIEMDWNEESVLEDGFKIFCLPARHFSGRSIQMNRSLWASFLVQSPSFSFYAGGDSGYDSFYKEIGDRFRLIDLVMLDNGQYGQGWKYIHMMPEEAFQAAKDLNAERFLPLHSSKYVLSVHSWDEPLERVSDAAQGSKEVKLITPVIGEPVNLKDKERVFTRWWKSIE